MEEFPPDQPNPLKNLMALKRHEAPPPGFFLNFSSRVIARIEAETPAVPRTLWNRLSSWLGAHELQVSATALTFAGFAFVGVSLYFVLSTDATPPAGGGLAGTAMEAPQAAGLVFPTRPQSVATHARSQANHGPGTVTVVIQDHSVRLEPAPGYASPEADAAAELFRTPTLRSIRGERVDGPIYRRSLE